MRRFQFRLERVLKLKEQRERLAELRLQQARLAVEAAQARVQSLQEDLARAAQALQSKIGQATTPGEWLARADHSTVVGKTLQAAEAQVQLAEQALHAAAAERTRLATEVEALLHLRREAWALHCEAMQQSEQERLDELGMRRWKANQAAAGSPAARSLSGGEAP